MEDGKWTMENGNISTFNISTFNLSNAPDPDNAGVGNGLWSLTKVGSTPTVGRFN
ncbi:hypothetical protein WG904_04410 [Pedobacter sp. Du54]|uniref:hypothetical protein n=1 Tax=Pedobacter anseongensis TaxID=3133439 RepID=UPI003098E736